MDVDGLANGLANRPADRLAEFVTAHAPLFVITGAGCSTESGIADYRGRDGKWKRPMPVQLSEFLALPAARRRYWARSMVGWPEFEAAQPNAAHRGLAALERAGLLEILVTQNVDRLHHEARHKAVIELHGRLDRVICVDCGREVSRGSVQRWLESHNARFVGRAAPRAPDGDADLALVEADNLDDFSIPSCPHCGGMMKPDVVFYGESVPKPRVVESYRALERSRGVLIVGSSVSVFSSFRFCRKAAELALPIAAVNQGVTRADELLEFKIDSAAGATMAALACALCAPPSAPL
ncbi:MAG: NAD-dependent protein deacetylase [Gammaproteobacteria bacterium]|nr:NAD-dependent protein deacetylase [Gammaproteobacteria bacterium]